MVPYTEIPEVTIVFYKAAGWCLSQRKLDSIMTERIINNSGLRSAVHYVIEISFLYFLEEL